MAGVKTIGELKVKSSLPSSTFRLHGDCTAHNSKQEFVGQPVTTSSVTYMYQQQDQWYAETRNAVYKLTIDDDHVTFLQKTWPDVFSVQSIAPSSLH